MIAKSRAEFEKAAADLPTCTAELRHARAAAEVVCIEPLERTDARPLRCIIRTKNGRLYVTTY
jgi:hypothetical protein